MTTFAYRSRNVSMVGTIYDSRLTEMTRKWANKKGTEIARVAKGNLAATGAVRTGHLLASVRSETARRAGGVVLVRVHAGAGYAAYVHEGTYGPILPHGNFLWVPKYKRSGPGALRIKRRFVAGQEANPFLSDAMFEVLVATQLPLF